eukprot:tig00000681_g3068.t1
MCRRWRNVAETFEWRNLELAVESVEQLDQIASQIASGGQECGGRRWIRLAPGASLRLEVDRRAGVLRASDGQKSPWEAALALASAVSIQARGLFSSYDCKGLPAPAEFEPLLRPSQPRGPLAPVCCTADRASAAALAQSLPRLKRLEMSVGRFDAVAGLASLSSLEFLQIHNEAFEPPDAAPLIEGLASGPAARSDLDYFGEHPRVVLTSDVGYWRERLGGMRPLEVRPSERRHQWHPGLSYRRPQDEPGVAYVQYSRHSTPAELAAFVLDLRPRAVLLRTPHAGREVEGRFGELLRSQPVVAEWD